MSVNKIQLNLDAAGSVDPEGSLEEAEKARKVLESRQGEGNDFLGWLDLPLAVDDSRLDEIQESATNLRKSDAAVIVGIGGSYLGARAVIEALRDPFDTGAFPVHFAGHHMDSFYHNRLLRSLSKSRYSVNVISKSGTTTEPGLAFRFLWNDLMHRFGSDALRELVVATTDAHKGSLRLLSQSWGLKSFVIPDDVGGRFSVFTPVGLLPIAVAGFDIRKLMEGARLMRERLREGGEAPGNNPALLYAAYRNAAYAMGKKIEILASYLPSLHYLSEWWKQLYGESEGKEGRGIYPASVDLTTDLHSMGQWIQEGERTIFETVLDVEEREPLMIPAQESDEDGLNYLAGRSLHDVNRVALQATRKAHQEGGVPVATLQLPSMNEEVMGGLLYLFQYACGISATMLGVNPFNQPGVEAYKTNMFQMLGKPGY